MDAFDEEGDEFLSAVCLDESLPSQHHNKVMNCMKTQLTLTPAGQQKSQSEAPDKVNSKSVSSSTKIRPRG